MQGEKCLKDFTSCLLDPGVHTWLPLGLAAVSGSKDPVIVRLSVI